VFLYLSDLGLAIPLSGGGHRQKYPEVDVNTARSRYNPVQLRWEKRAAFWLRSDTRWST